jgi:hypothetical protein
MKKKVKTTVKKRVIKPTKKSVKKDTHTTVQKIMVGEDEFCPTCMEWRAFDEISGRCKVCGRIIKKIGDTRKITDEYDLKDFTIEHDDQQETGEN